MTDAEFETLVAAGVDAIPPRFLKKLENVAIVIADLSTREQMDSGHTHKGETLLGLYEGIPLTERGDFYGTGMTLPDRITIFKLPTLEMAEGNSERVKDIVRDTVWHEIAHYFGYDDAAIERREDAGTNHPNTSGEQSIKI